MSTRTGLHTAGRLRIFLNYRREDTRGDAGRLYDDLVEHFGKERVFRDVDALRAGEDFDIAIADAVKTCDVVIALVGRQWLTVADAEGRRRIDNPDDFVRLELQAALDEEVTVVPLRVEGADMPSSDELPSGLGRFARKHALEISDSRWSHDRGRLIRELERIERERVPSILERGAQRATEPEKVEDEPGGGPPPVARYRRDASRRRRLLLAAAGAGLAALVVAIVLIAGGGGSSDTSSGPSDSGAAADAAAISAGGPISVNVKRARPEIDTSGGGNSTAAKRLRSESASFNEGQRRFVTRLADDSKAGNHAALVADASQFRDVIYYFDADFRKIDFPAALGADVDTVLGANGTAIAGLDAIGQTTDLREFERLFNRFTEDKNAAVSAVNDLLGKL